jgi:uncharacterized protein
LKIRSLFIRRSGRIRSGWRILIYIALTAALAQVAALLYYGIVPVKAVPVGLRRDEAGLLLGISVLFCLVSLASAWVVIRFVDRRPFRQLGFAAHPRVGLELVQGLAAGFVMIACVFAAEYVSGSVRVGKVLTAWPEILRDGGVYFTVFAFAAALEEILARGYCLQALIDGTGRVAAVAITSFLFGLGHVMNPHADAFSVANTVVAGIWLASAYVKTRSLWLPTALHLSWNFSMAWVFGFPVSGLRVSNPLIELQQGGRSWITGGMYGPEGGVLCTAVMVLSTIWIIGSPHVRRASGAESLWESPTGAAPDPPSHGQAYDPAAPCGP